MKNSDRKNLKSITETVREIVSEVASYIKNESNNFQRQDIETKNVNDFFSYVDKESERLLVKELSGLIPGANFITEEKTIDQGNGNGYCWIIDPLDGTSNFIHGSTPYAISVALKKDQEIIVGVIHEITRNESFYSWKDGGAYLNGAKIQVSSVEWISDALISTGRPHNYLYNYSELMDLFNHFQYNTHGLRQSGSAATDLAYVACGRYDGRYESGLSPWDMAAGILIVKQAGGNVCDFNGKEEYLKNGTLIASNQLIFNEFVSIVDKICYGKKLTVK
uniref:inositol monophosphatase family protein n=1 Tax=uncultured Draconibacterium sp. TaxID=1573823 RepID=UPI0032169CFF